MKFALEMRFFVYLCHYLEASLWENNMYDLNLFLSFLNIYEYVLVLPFPFTCFHSYKLMLALSCTGWHILFRIYGLADVLLWDINHIDGK